MPIGGGFGGRSLGQAMGSITVDTSQVEQAAVKVKRVGRDIEQSLGGIGRQNIGQTLSNQFGTAARGAQAFGNQINNLRGEIAAVGVAGAVLSKIGIDGAKNIRNYRVSFRTLLGDEQKAVDLMRQLTTQANDFGIEVEEVWQLARALLPTLKGNTDQLDEFVKRAALLASTNPLKSTVDASRAIQEYLAGQTISLQRLFNVDPNLIAEAQARFNDVGQELDFILGRMGATEEGAKEMADAWVGVKNELRLALAEGFTPLLEVIRPLLTQFREWVSELRQSNPALLQVGAGVAAIAAVGAPALLFFGQLVSSAQKLKTVIDAINTSKLAGIGGALGTAAAGAAAVAGGVGLGIGATRAIGRATGREDLANANLAQLWQQIRQILFVIVSGISLAILTVGNLFISAGEKFNEIIAAMAQGVAGFVRFIGSVLPEELGGGKLREVGDGLQKFSEDLRRISGERATDARTRLQEGQKDFLRGALDFLGLAPGAAPSAGAGGVAPIGDGGAGEDERLQRLEEFNQEMARIEESRLKQTTDATEQYARQRAETIEQYERQAARETEDYQRQRRRQEQQFLRDVQRINQERIEREAEWAQELTERLAEIRAESSDRIAEIQETGNDRIADIEEDYRQDRERREREHRNNLLTAASRLDATAIAEEQRRFALQNRDAEEQFQDRVEQERESLQERLEQEQENLQERIEQEQRAHEERLLEARQADARRIQDMREALNEQQRIEDEDRAIRLQRAKEDHQLQLQAQAEAHRMRLQQIREQAEEERKLLLQQFEDIMDLIGSRGPSGSGSGTVTEYGDAYRPDRDLGPIHTNDDWRDFFPGFQGGGVVPYTGPAMVHGSRSRPEYMLNPATTAALQSMLGNFSQAGLINAVAGGSRNMTLNLSNGAIVVNGAPGQSEERLAALVRMEFEGLLRSVAG